MSEPLYDLQCLFTNYAYFSARIEEYNDSTPTGDP